MPAYIIAAIEVKDPGPYEQYKPIADASVAKFGGKIIVKGGKREDLEGGGGILPHRAVIAEFPTYEQALAWYHSDDYQAAVRIRKTCTETSMLLIDGFTEP